MSDKKRTRACGGLIDPKKVWMERESVELFRPNCTGTITPQKPCITVNVAFTDVTDKVRSRVIEVLSRSLAGGM